MRRAVLKSFDQDGIHDLRVASRRFRAALELYAPFAPKGAKAELRKGVRKLTRVLGGLRNIDEALVFFKSRARPGISAGSRICHALSGQRSRELRRVERELTAFDHHGLDRMARDMVAALYEDRITKRRLVSLPAYFSDVSIRLYLPIQQLLERSGATAEGASRHALRIAIKKWRYFLELAAPVLDRDYTDVLGLLREYQAVLGRMNDIREFEELLDNMEVPRDERDHGKALLMAEDARLLEVFRELVERKPLNYTFLM